jgi:hypothetical protein
MRAYRDDHADGCGCPVCEWEAEQPGVEFADIRDHLTALAHNLRAFAERFRSDRQLSDGESAELAAQVNADRAG